MMSETNFWLSILSVKSMKKNREKWMRFEEMAQKISQHDQTNTTATFGKNYGLWILIQTTARKVKFGEKGQSWNPLSCLKPLNPFLGFHGGEYLMTQKAFRNAFQNDSHFWDVDAISSPPLYLWANGLTNLSPWQLE